jgi:hypothetical protein
MKLLQRFTTLACILVAPFTHAAEKPAGNAPADAMKSAETAIEQFGGISICDGSSFFTFSKDGSFESGPLGMSGRTMKGHWTKDADGHLVATARLGWINGASSGDQYRRIVFFISHVSKRKEEGDKIRHGFAPSTLFDSYFFIEEMMSIPKPREEIPK